MHLLIRLVIVVGFLGALAAEANAYLFKEHYDICYAAYMASCDELQPAKSVSASAGERRRYTRACGATERMRRSMASRFGEACAVAGDHVDSPEEMLEEGAYANSNWIYLALASGNADHFHPATVYRFDEYYGRALKLAMDAFHAPHREDRDFRLAFYTAAFAGHHIADAHSAGHMGFHRANSGATVSGVIHDEFNEKGRWVRDLAGNVWKTFGDGEICKPSSPVVEVVKDYPPAVLDIEKRRCNRTSNTIFRFVSRNAYQFTSQVLSRFIYGESQDFSTSPAMFIPHDIWQADRGRNGLWYSSINYSPARTQSQLEFLFKDVGGDDFSLNLSASWAPVKRTRLRLATGLGLGTDESGSIRPDHWEVSAGAIFTPDVPFSIFTPEIFGDLRGLSRFDRDDVVGPVIGGRLMVEAYVANLAVEAGWQGLYGDSGFESAPFVALGIGKVFGASGGHPVKIRAADKWQPEGTVPDLIVCSTCAKPDAPKPRPALTLLLSTGTQSGTLKVFLVEVTTKRTFPLLELSGENDVGAKRVSKKVNVHLERAKYPKGTYELVWELSESTGVQPDINIDIWQGDRPLCSFHDNKAVAQAALPLEGRHRCTDGGTIVLD